MFCVNVCFFNLTAKIKVGDGATKPYIYHNAAVAKRFSETSGSDPAVNQPIGGTGGSRQMDGWGHAGSGNREARTKERRRTVTGTGGQESGMR